MVTYEQLANPNLNTGTGKIGYCLAKQIDVWGVPHGLYPHAKAAWDAIPTEYKHPNELPPPGVATLMWWTYFVGPEDQGHVATSQNDGWILSSPYSTSTAARYQQGGTTQAVLPSKAELERIYSSNGKHPLTYLGWSEFMINKRVVQPKEEDMLTLSGAARIHRFRLGEEPSEYTKKNRVGKMTEDQADAEVKASPRYLQYVEDVRTGKVNPLQNLPVELRQAMEDFMGKK